MRPNFLTFFLIFALATPKIFSQEIIEIPLTQREGFGFFNAGLSGMSTYSEDADNAWKKTYLKVSGIPKNWSEIKVGDIETNIYQSVYQNYFLGNITKAFYEELQKGWNWIPDTTQLSRTALKTKIACAYGKDSSGQIRVIVDANNNLDFKDDVSFIPFEKPAKGSLNLDSIAKTKTIIVSHEQYVGNKIVERKTPLVIVYLSQIKLCMVNFPIHAIATFNETKIAVCSDRFSTLAYNNPSILVLDDSLKEGTKMNADYLIEKNEYLEIKGFLYKNKGVNVNNNTLKLEKINTPKNQLISTQIGFKPFSFEGEDFITQKKISLNEAKGKFVLLDFWAVWCKPCREEIPNLRALYAKTSRDKFEIISIVGESDPDALKKIIEADSIEWPQILSTDLNKINENYEIEGYPTLFLLNPDGFIIEKNLRGAELEKKVLELLKK